MKTALVTGANKGLGFEIAKQLGLKGFHVFVTGRNEDNLREAVQALNMYEISVRYVVMDVTSLESIEQAFSKISKECTCIDVLVNNAGILKDHNLPLFEIDTQTIKETFNTNTFGPYLITKCFLPLLQNGARVINISSEGGKISGAINTWAHAYCMSKTMLNVLTRHMAEALNSKGILVNAMCPGWTMTDMGGKDATRSVEKGAETAIWLATEKHQYKGMFFKDKKIINW
jgi:NAD(P)-dependent dehydrogenase (short-subunit alcohol dehydrogenase family)